MRTNQNIISAKKKKQTLYQSIRLSSTTYNVIPLGSGVLSGRVQLGYESERNLTVIWSDIQEYANRNIFYESPSTSENHFFNFQLLDHIFIIIDNGDTDNAHRELLDFKTFVQHTCGQNMNL